MINTNMMHLITKAKQNFQLPRKQHRMTMLYPSYLFLIHNFEYINQLTKQNHDIIQRNKRTK